MYKRQATELLGTTEVEFRGKRFDLKAPFERVRYPELFREHNGCGIRDEAAVRARAAELGLDLPAGVSQGKLVNEVFEKTCEPHLSGPCFLTDYPIEICPLTKAHPDDPTLGERFEVFVDGMELGNAFTELNDPAEQERRFEEQVASRDPEAPGQVDVDYVQALEYGMPPTGGLGIGIDRLCMLLANQASIRDVLLFPAMRPLSDGVQEEAGAPAAS